MDRIINTVVILNLFQDDDAHKKSLNHIYDTGSLFLKGKC
jgi:hypothetical protein